MMWLQRCITSGAAATIVLLALADLLGFGFHRLAVRLEGLDRRLAAETFGGDPTFFETMTHHDAAGNSSSMLLVLSLFPALGTICRR
jgi:hypothetical protein